MTREEQLSLIKQGAEKWNQWRDLNTDLKPDLSEADLRQTNLQKANLSQTNLNKAKLQFSNLTGANLKEANLKKAKFQEAILQSANLKNANLAGAGMFEVNLQYANLENANLEGVQFNEDVLFNQTNLKGANLQGTTGLSSSQLDLAIKDKKRNFLTILKKKWTTIFFCKCKSIKLLK